MPDHAYAPKDVRRGEGRAGLPVPLRPVDSARGAIRHVALHAPAYEARCYATVYAALLDSLPQDAHVSVLLEAEAVDAARVWLEGRPNVKAIDAPAGKSLTPWARDAMLACRDSLGAPALIAGSRLDRRDDPIAPALFAKAASLALHPVEVALEGGDVLVDADAILVGADTLARMPGEDAEARGEALRAALGEPDGRRRLVIVESPFPIAPEATSDTTLAGEGWSETTGYGNRPHARQPIFHIDMFLTLVGKRAAGRPIVLVGDPAMAAALIGAPQRPDAGQAHFDAIAALLEREGFAVVRNPLPYLPMDEPKARRRTWFHAPTNNALVQRDDAAGDVVWLPSFGHDHSPELAVVDARMAAIWRALGFEVRFVPDCLLLAENLGGLHCLANVIDRS